jgi:hypothetical protein
MAVRREPRVALTTFLTEVKGQELLVRAGDSFPASSPVVKGREELFVAQGEYVNTKGKPPAA